MLLALSLVTNYLTSIIILQQRLGTVDDDVAAAAAAFGTTAGIAIFLQ